MIRLLAPGCAAKGSTAEEIGQVFQGELPPGRTANRERAELSTSAFRRRLPNQMELSLSEVRWAKAWKSPFNSTSVSDEEARYSQCACW